MLVVKSRFFLPFFLFFGFLALYIHNLSNSVYGGDVGDLVTAAYVHGVAHAPGYPLFTFVGYILTKIIPWYSPAWKVGLISSFSSASGLLFFFLLLKKLTKNTVVSFLSTCILGFSFFYWFYAEIAEVFALHIFFTILLFYVAVLFRQTKKYWYGVLLFFVFGLSCTNHQTIVLLIPSLLTIIFPSLITMWKNSKKKIFFLLLAIVVGFSPYLYVVVASSTHPILNWDNVHDIQSFFHLLLRMDYGTFQSGAFVGSTFFQRLVSLQVYSLYILSQLTIPVCVLSCIGFWILWKEKRQRIYFFALSIAFFLSGPFFIFYSGFPINSSFTLGVYERFFIMSGVIFLIPFSYGLIYIAEKMDVIFPKRSYAFLIEIVFFIIPLALLFYNFPKTDLSATQLGDSYAKDVLRPLPQHTILIASGDTLVFNMWYVHFVLHVRPDITIYNVGGGTSDVLLGNKKINQKSSTDEMIDAFKNIDSFTPVYSTFIFQSKDEKQLTWVPYGFAYQLLPDNQSLPSQSTYSYMQQKIWNSLDVPSPTDLEKKVNHSLTIAQIPTAYSNAMIAVGTYFYTKYKDKKDALLYYNKAVQVAPTNASAYLARGVYFLGEDNNCGNITSDFSTSLQLDPFQEPAYFLLYNAYKKCVTNPQAAASVKKAFANVFQQDFDKESKTVLTNVTLQ